MTVLPQIIIASFLVSLTALTGAVLLVKKNLPIKKYIPSLVSFAAGVILTTAFLDLLPEAVELSDYPKSIFMATLGGIVSFFFLERFLLWFHHHDEPHGDDPSNLLVLVGDSFHNFIDGVAIAATFLTNPALGVTTTIAIAAHEIPHEFANFTILIHGGMKKGKALLYNFLSSLVAMAGAIGGYFYLQTLQNAAPYLLSFSAGMFIYIACSDLIPDMHQDFNKQKGSRLAVPFIVGILLMYLSITYLHHGE